MGSAQNNELAPFLEIEKLSEIRSPLRRVEKKNRFTLERLSENPTILYKNVFIHKCMYQIVSGKFIINAKNMYRLRLSYLLQITMDIKVILMETR